MNFELRVRHYALSWFSLSITGGHIIVGGYAPRDARIVKACETGDEATIRGILQARQAGPNDYFTVTDVHDAWLYENDLVRGDYNLLTVRVAEKAYSGRCGLMKS